MKNKDVIVISSEGSTDIWNLFREVESGDDFRDLCRSLYPIPPEVRDPHWIQCSRIVARALLTALYRRAREENEEVDNRMLVDFLRTHKLKGVYDLICEYDDLMGAATYIDPSHPRHASSVFSTFRRTFSRIFYGDFAKSGDFSVREYVKDPQDKTLILDMKKEASAPVFRLLVDWAIENTLVNDGRHKYFLLDEFQMLPHLQFLEMLLDTGRHYKCQSLLGLRSVAPFQSRYGRTATEGLLAKLPQMISHRCGDRATVNFVRSKIGRVRSKRKFKPCKYGGQKKVVTESYPYSEQDLLHLSTGEAVAVAPTSWSSPFKVWRLPESHGFLVITLILEGRAMYVLPAEGTCELLRRGGSGFETERKDYIRLRRDLPVLVVGETGSGKTTTLKLFATQQLVDKNEPRVVFNYKESWKEFFGGD